MIVKIHTSHPFQLRDCDLGPIVNRDLTRRVRTVNGLTAHKALAQKDLGFAAKLVQAADKRANLYQPPPPDAEAEPEGAAGQGVSCLGFSCATSGS